MKKCKCLKSVNESQNEAEFQEGRLYLYEFLPSPGLGTPFYRVFDNDGGFQNFDMKIFKQHFEK